MAGKEVGRRKLVRGETSVIGLLQEQHEQVLSITSAASGAGISGRRRCMLAWKCICGSCRGCFGRAHASVWHSIHRCGIYGAWPVVMGAVAVVRIGITLGASVGAPCGARGVRAQPRMHLSGPAESWHDLARERGGDGKGPTRPPRARPRPTTYLCLEPNGRPICPVARCVLRDESRVRGPR